MSDLPSRRDPLAQEAQGPICTPHAATRASGPSGYATTSSVLAIVLVAGSFDRFVNSARRLFQAGVQQGPGAMTPSSPDSLRSSRRLRHGLVLDLDRVEANFRAIQRALPLAHVYYAVKANPARPVLERLVRLASRFDAASFEVAACLSAGARPEAISYGSTIKKASAIRRAHTSRRQPVRFRFRRGAREAGRERPGARVYCRILVGNEGADWPLSRKFGTTVEMAKDLMLRVAGELVSTPTACRSTSAASRPPPARTRWRSARWQCCSPT